MYVVLSVQNNRKFLVKKTCRMAGFFLLVTFFLLCVARSQHLNRSLSIAIPMSAKLDI